ncbi:MAG: hydroxymethylglutaryl-CoA synthase [Bdellovibrionota bacterium]
MASVSSTVGIDKLAFYPGTLKLSLERLASARGRAQNYPRESLGVEFRSIVPFWEDAVTMSVNAANSFLTDEERDSIRLLIVGSESSFDNEKCLATWVHRFLGLNKTCRSVELKGACYAGTAALMSAASYLSSGAIPLGGRALVISADHSQAHFRHAQEFGLGAGAAAALVSHSPRLADLDPRRTGFATIEAPYLLRPSMTEEVGDFQSSIFSYFELFDEVVENYRFNTGVDSPLDSFDRLVMHAPFPEMPHLAIRNFLGGKRPKEAIHELFTTKIAPSLEFARQTGSTYGATTFYGLASLLAGGFSSGSVGMFAFGAGSHGELFSLDLHADTESRENALELKSALTERGELSVEEYEWSERRRLDLVGVKDAAIEAGAWSKVYDAHYLGRKRLVLAGIKDYHRSYEWS